MNFFQSLLADDPEPESEPTPHPELHHQAWNDAGPWSFGGLIKTLTVKSESVIETYRRDLREFGSGLKKEIEVAQGSLGTVGHAIDEIVVKGTAQIISQGKEALLTVSSDNPESDSDNSTLNRAHSGGLSSKRYSRFDAQVLAVQGDPGTYTEEPEDMEEFAQWKLGFKLEGKREEMRKLLESAEMGSVYRRLVPGVVDEEGFWLRYYYKVYKLQLAEDVRAKIVRRAISRDEEELSWDVDDEEEERDREVEVKKSDEVERNAGLGREGSVEVVKEDAGDDSLREGDGKNEGNLDAKKVKEEVDDERGLDKGLKEEKMAGSGKSAAPNVANVEESKGIDVVMDEHMVSATDLTKDSSAQEDEDLGWDEIEDLSGIDQNREIHSGTPDKADLMKRLNTAEEEDLSWDIEDEDDNENLKVKA